MRMQTVKRKSAANDIVECTLDNDRFRRFTHFENDASAVRPQEREELFHAVNLSREWSEHAPIEALGAFAAEKRPYLQRKPRWSDDRRLVLFCQCDRVKIRVEAIAKAVHRHPHEPKIGYVGSQDRVNDR